LFKNVETFVPDFLDFVQTLDKNKAFWGALAPQIIHHWQQLIWHRLLKP